MIAHSSGQFAAGRAPGLDDPAKRVLDPALSAAADEVPPVDPQIEFPDAQPRSPFYAPSEAGRSEGALTTAVSETLREYEPDPTPIIVRSTPKTKMIPTDIVPSAAAVKQTKKKKTKEVKDALYWKLLGGFLVLIIYSFYNLRIRRQCVINKHARHPETLKLWKTVEGRDFGFEYIGHLDFQKWPEKMVFSQKRITQSTLN